ncbi:MAG: phosphatase PAP2 family protein [Clostridia bacterium]|nr:phosphatase PAP2 family protein [Clostridia bacterium]
MAEWLNSTFYGFDRSIFLGMHALAESAGGFITPLFKVITFLGDKGWAFLLAAVILMLFKNTRKVGFAMIFAVACGAVITNITLKNIVDRTRPFLASEEYNGFWLFVQGELEDESSFPSGHTTAAMAAMTALFLTCNKKWSWVGFLFALLMGVTRLYFVVHYATDVIAGLLSGTIGGIAGYYLMKLCYKLLEKYKDKKFCTFALEFNLTDLFKKKEKTEE